MHDAIETRNVGSLTVEVHYDDTGSESPRDWCNMGRFFGFHRRYVSPDAAPDAYPEAARSIAQHHDNICLPVWLYDHSGTCYRAAESNPFHCPWDSGLFGFIYVSKADVRREYGVKRISPKLRAKVIEALQQEVKVYSAWANGEVYGFTVTDPAGDQIDSCWGFVAEPDYALSEGMDSARAILGEDYVPIQAGPDGPVYVSPTT